MKPRTSPDFPELNADNAEIWDKLAEWWDDQIGDGNDFQNYLIEPATERLLALKPGDTVLDIACGAGRFARRMADLGAKVVAFDQTERFIERARKRTGKDERIEYHVLNATDRASLLTLGERRYDAAVCTMALMDMPSIEPLVSTLPRLLKPGGQFVFSVPHPAFNSGTTRKIAEEFTQGTEVFTRYSVAVSEYTEPFAYKTLGIAGQPELQYGFHRPISLLFQLCFQHGFVLDGLEEPALPEELVVKARRPLSWARYLKIPELLVARMRLL